MINSHCKQGERTLLEIHISTHIFHNIELDIYHEIISIIENTLWNCQPCHLWACDVCICVGVCMTKVKSFYAKWAWEPFCRSFLFIFQKKKKKKGFVLVIWLVLEVTGAFIIKWNQEWQGKIELELYFFLQGHSFPRRITFFSLI